jgi:DNA adenine methylase
VKPLLKWPGGKTRELSVVRERWPEDVGTYVEPFVGGGAVFFDRAPARAVLGDANPQLMGLYRRVRSGDPALVAALEEIAGHWDEVLTAAGAATGPLAAAYAHRGRAGEAPPEDALAALVAAVEPAPVREYAARSLRDKWRRMRRLEEKHATTFDDALLRAQLETALRAGYYTWIRDEEVGPLAGDEAAAVAGGSDPAGAARSARFFFVRELCYGSMFRQNKAGRFNIPYGGKGYNRKRVRTQAGRLLDPERRELLGRAELVEGDFRELFAGPASGLGPEDLVFLDPPYDSDFSAYAGRSFGEPEQRALGQVVAGLECRVLGIMKATPLVREIYREAAEAWAARGRTLRLSEYAKTYGYNVRGRNDRAATHLLLEGL